MWNLAFIYKIEFNSKKIPHNVAFLPARYFYHLLLKLTIEK